jgi:hypothetical protein
MFRSVLFAGILLAGAASAQDAGFVFPDAGAAAATPSTPAPAPPPQIIVVPMPVQAPPAPETVEPQQDERVRHFFLTALAGAGHIDLHTVAADGSTVSTRNTGIFGGLRAGFTFLKFLGIGVEGRLGHFLGEQPFDTIVALLQLQAQVSLGPARVFAQVGGGFAYAGNFQGCTIGGNCPVASRGYALHAGVGLDIQIFEAFSVGAVALGDTMNAGPVGFAQSSIAQLANPGDAAALQVAVMGRATLHF